MLSYNYFFKRYFDIIFATFFLITLSPILFFFSLLIRKYLGSPILFKQLRLGLLTKSFTILKFRTMTLEKNFSGNLLNDEKRMTKIGTFFRKYSLDELPELLNVLKGDMSLVGPRPLLMEYLPLYSKEQMRRHEVKPGITGWAQVNGRNALSWQDKFELDVWYVDNRSFFLDVKILFLTLFKVIHRESINAHGYVTAPKFEGNKKQVK